MSRQKILTKTNDKEVTAVKFNLKEQRCLQKNLATLDSEAQYSLKLIDLNNRGIRIFYKRFKDKVGKIKSHLKTNEISDMKYLEENGKLGDMIRPLTFSGALRIADAEKRLKLQGRDQQRKTKSALPLRHFGTPGNSELSEKRPSTVHLSLESSDRRMSLRPKNLSGDGYNSVNNSTLSLDKGPDMIVRKPSDVFPKSIPKVNPISLSNKATPTNSSSKSPRVDNKKITKPTSPRKTSPSPRKTPRDDKFASIHLENTSNKSAEIPLFSLNSGPESKDIEEDFIILPVSQMQFPKPSLDKNNDTRRLSFQDRLPVARINNMAPVDEIPESITDDNEKKDFDMNCNIQETEQNHDKFENLQLEDENIDKNHDKKKHVTISSEYPDLNKSSFHDKRSISRVSNFTRSSTQTSASGGQFSCHVVNDNSRESTKSPFHSNDSFLGYLGEDPYEERRRVLLEGEQMRSLTILDKKDDFLDRIDEYLRINFPEEETLPDEPLSEVQKENVESGDQMQILSRKQKRLLRESKRRADDEGRRRAKDLWKDVNKCSSPDVADV